MFSVITNIYNKKAKWPTLMELFTQASTYWRVCGKNMNIVSMCAVLTRVWQKLEYRIDVCRVTRGARIEHL
jgi:hypothetical protein